MSKTLEERNKRFNEKMEKKGYKMRKALDCPIRFHGSFCSVDINTNNVMPQKIIVENN